MTAAADFDASVSIGIEIEGSNESLPVNDARTSSSHHVVARMILRQHHIILTAAPLIKVEDTMTMIAELWTLEHIK